jgi:hypothetical protein
VTKVRVQTDVEFCSISEDLGSEEINFCVAETRFLRLRSDDGMVEPVKNVINYQTFNLKQRFQMARAHNLVSSPDNWEDAAWGRMLEQGTCTAAFLDLETRFKDSRLCFIDPAVFTAFCDPAGIPDDQGNEAKIWLSRLHESEVAYVMVWANGPPRHYTYHRRATARQSLTRIR